jgi:hypothetical protein
VAADATIGIADFFRLDGNFGIESSTRSLKLSDDSTVDVNVLSIAGQDVSGFAGVNGGTANAAGLSLTNVDFGFVTAVDTLDPTRRWKTLQATADSVAVLGIPDVTIAGSNLVVNINRPDLDGLVANYAAAPLDIQLAGGQTYTINLNGANGPLLEAAGTLTVSVSDFFTVTGSFALRRAAANVTLADGTTADVTLLTLGIDGGTPTLPSPLPATSPTLPNAGPPSRPASMASASPDLPISQSPQTISMSKSIVPAAPSLSSTGLPPRLL